MEDNYNDTLEKESLEARFDDIQEMLEGHISIRQKVIDGRAFKDRREFMIKRLGELIEDCKQQQEEILSLL